MSRHINWGIISTGNIANEFAKDLKLVPDATLLAVASRTEESAEQFSRQHGIPRYYNSYEALAQDPEIDVMYIATPHMFHKENALLGLQNNKAVLCEKSFTINANEAEILIRYAREHKLFLMEGMWNRFQPVLVKLRSLLSQGIIGDVLMVNACLGMNFKYNPEGRLFNPKLGGGALLDVGIYPVSLVFMILGKPTQIKSIGTLGKTNVDELAGIVFGYETGQIATIYTALRVNTPETSTLMGTKGNITIHGPLYRPTGLTVSLPDQPDQYFKAELNGNGLNYEAKEVMHCLSQQKTESEIMPLDETLAIMETMDAIREQWDLFYPGE